MNIHYDAILIVSFSGPEGRDDVVPFLENVLRGKNVPRERGAAILVYLLIPLGVVLFVRPAVGTSSSLWVAFVWGSVFGLVLYGVYDLTNRAILEK